MKTVTIPDFKGYIELPKPVWTEVENLIVGKHPTEEVDKLLESYPVTASKPTWVKDLPYDWGAAAMTWKKYILVRGQQ